MNQLAPIVLFTYNRPWHTEQTLIALSKNEFAYQSILYIYCDGPKEGSSVEQKSNIEQVREVVRRQKWCKDVFIIESNKNKGLANSIITGVTEVIKKHGKVIVLEDDLVTSPYFLKYMNESLSFYQNYPAVFSIGANRPPIDKMKIPDDYQYDVFVSLRSYSTGWATWKDRWELIDWSLDYYNKIDTNTRLKSAFNRSGEDMFKMLELQKNGKIDSWAIRFGYNHFLNHAVAILPRFSYVDNIGFDGSGIHSGIIQNTYRNNLALAIENPVYLDTIYEDKDIINAMYSWLLPKKRPLWQKIINRISRMFGGKNMFVIKKKIYV